MDEVGLRRVCAWIGNSAHVAMKNDALLKSTDYMEAGARRAETTTRKSDAAGGGNRITTSRKEGRLPRNADRLNRNLIPDVSRYVARQLTR